MPSKSDDATGEPKVLGREPLRAPLPKRFYKDVGIAAVPEAGGAIAVQLDGRPVRTPKKRPLALPTRALADLVAEEWRQQGERIDPAKMPLTRLANTAIDAVAERKAEVAADVVAHAGSDLLCYRADGPEGLQRRQAAAWEPIVAWAEATFDCHFERAEGVMPIVQPPETSEQLAAAIVDLDEFRLAALHVMTTLTGSALLALAHVRGRLSLETAWAAAHIDEDWQIEQWGRDEEADARRAHRLDEMRAASRMWKLA